MNTQFDCEAVTDQQILNALRQAMFNLAVSGAQAYTINGRTFTRFDLDKIQEAISIYEIRIAASQTSNSINGGSILFSNY